MRSVVQRRSHRPGPGGCWFPGRTVTAAARRNNRTNDHYFLTGSRLRRIASSTSETSASSSSSSWHALLASYFSSSLSSSSSLPTGTASAASVDTNTNTASLVITSTSRTDRNRYDELESVVDRLVRDRLLKEFPQEFGTTTTTTSTGSQLLSFSSLRSLVVLSGYHRMELPTGTQARLYLAEGVVVAPPTGLSSYRKQQRDKLFQNYIANNHTIHEDRVRLFVQPQPPPPQNFPLRGGSSALGEVNVPPSNFVQTDLPLYRLLENSIAQLIDRQHSSLAQWYQRRLLNPLQTVQDRTRLRLKAWQRTITQHHASFRATAHTVFPQQQSLFELLLGYIQGQIFPRKDTIPSHNTYDSKKPHTTESSTTITLTHPNHTKHSRGGIPTNVTIISAASYNPGLFSEDDAVEETANDYNTTSSSGSSSNNRNARHHLGNSRKQNTMYDEDSYEHLIVVTSRPTSSSVSSQSAACSDDNNNANKTNNKTNNEDQNNNARIQNSSLRDTINATNNDDNVDDSVEDEMVTAVQLYHSMQPSTRILGLASPDYWTLRHSSASTCVHWGMVLGGAIPLSYRSYHFSLQYPWLVSPSTVALSVIATITYSIYKWRYHSRTAQASTIAAGLHQRLHARDTAALLVLQHTVVSNITAAILQTYYATSAQQENNTHSTTYISDNNNKATYSDDNRSTTVSSARLIDPIEWALDFGLLVTKQEQEEEKATCHSTITTPEPQHQELLLHEKDKEETTRSLPPLPSPPHTSTTNHNNNRKDDDDEQKTTHNENKKKNTTANHEAMMQATPEDSGHHKPGHTADDNNTRNTTAPTRVLVAVPFEEFVLPRNTKQK